MCLPREIVTNYRRCGDFQFGFSHLKKKSMDTSSYFFVGAENCVWCAGSFAFKDLFLLTQVAVFCGTFFAIFHFWPE